MMNRQFGEKGGLGGSIQTGGVWAATLSLVVASLVFNPWQARAQEPAAVVALPAFDTATVKPSTATDHMAHIQVDPTAFTDKNVTVKSLIAFAYGVQEYQIAGGPEWTNSVRFDVEATWKGGLDAHLPPGQLQGMVQRLLAERLNLKLQPNMRDLAVYDLTVAGGGAKLTNAPAATPDANGATTMISEHTSVRDGKAEIALKNATMASLAGLLSQQLDRQVTDKTGLEGSYDITLDWPANQSNAETIPAALEQQLGLKLESHQAPVKILTINQVQKPPTP